MLKMKMKKKGGQKGGGFWSNVQAGDYSPCLLKYAVFSILFIFVCMQCLRIMSNTSDIMYNVQKYFFLITVPLAAMFLFMINITDDEDARGSFIKMSITMAIVGLLIYMYTQVSHSSIGFSYYTNSLFLVVIALLGLSIVYNFLSQYLERLTGWPGFIVQMIFYLPCLFWNGWYYFMSELHATPYIVHGLIFIEVLTISAYLYLPTLMESALHTKDGIVLLKKKTHLDKGTVTIANSDVLKLNPDVHQTLTKGSLKQYASNYAFSMWIYINPQNSSSESYNKEMEIFSYGYKDEQGMEHVKPMIRYYGGGDGSDQVSERNKLIFYFVNYPPKHEYDYENNTFYDVTVPLQKWNHIVINYNRNAVDIFINGHLERTFDLKENIPMYNDLDNVTVGSLNGVTGVITNVIYFKHPLSSQQIAYEYTKGHLEL